MKNSRKKSVLLISFRIGGVAVILLIALLITYFLYQNNVDDQVFTNNYTTSILFSDSLASASGAAPWAFLSLNWFICRASIKRWLSAVTKWFS